MDIGRITEQEIRRALEHIRQARSLEDNALLESEAVATRLRQEGLTDTLESRSWILGGLLEAIVRSNLARARGIAPEQMRAADVRTIDDVKPLIEADFQASRPDREAWSSLYYRYFSRNAFQIGELAALGRPGSRHGRKFIGRRINRGLEMLSSILRELELEATGGEGFPDPVARDAIESPHRSDTPAPPNNLPAPLSRIIGRERDIERVADLLDDQRLVTLTGTAGAGKTRLALETARRLAPRYAAGTWFVGLAGLTDPQLVAHTLADVLGVEEAERRAPFSAVIETIGAEPALIVLDNCEHLIDASAHMAAGLLKACPQARVLATSREPLSVEGEQTWPLPPLPVPPPEERDDLELSSKYAAVQLLADRASAADPRFQLDDENVSAVAEVCARLDGMPLALELAAARVRMMPPADIAARLDERFSILDRGPRTADPRQRTLWAAIDWSHALLPRAEQVLLRRLSAFRDGWTLDAAEQVCADDQLSAVSVLDGMTQLVDKSLVLSTSADEDGLARYGMLESIRAFAAVKRRDADECEEVGRRHVRWCLALAEAASDGLTGRGQSHWLTRLVEEAENLRHALEWSAADDESAEAGLRLVALLTPFWRQRGRPSEGRHWIERLLETPAGAERTSLRARALDGAGALAFQQGDYTAAREFHAESVKIHRSLDEPERVAESLRHLGNVADETGDYEGALAHYHEALDIWRATGNEWGQAATRNNLGLVALRRGDYATAEQHLTESLGRFRDLGTDWAVAVTLSNLGDAALARGEPREARQRMADSLTLVRQLDDQEGMAYALTGMAHAESLLGHHAAARRLLGESLIVLERMGSKLGMVEWLEVAAMLTTEEGRDEDAVQTHAAVDALRRAIDSPLPPKDRAAKDEALRNLRARLGDEEFESLWVTGATLRGQDAAALAIGTRGAQSD